MKNNKKQRALRPRLGLIVYLALLFYSVILTQLLRNPLSAIFFWFLLTVGPLSFVLMLIGRAVIQVYVTSEVQRTEKLSPVEYEIRIINQSPVPYPFVEATVTQPTDNGVRSTEEHLVLSLIPFGGYIVKKNVSFRYRGLYEIGVKELFIGDFLRMWRIRVDVANYSNVTVYPRKLRLECPQDAAVSDVPTQSVRALNTEDMSEVSNIREYRMGDQLKAVHWKLSSKAEELQVKDYNTNDDRHVYIFVDLASPTLPPEEKKARAARRLRRILRDRDRDGRRRAIGKLAGDTEKLGARISSALNGMLDEIREKRRKAKYRRRRAKGNSAASIETMDMIDDLIRQTSGKSADTKKAKKQANKSGRQEARAADEQKLSEEAAARDKVIKQLSDTIDGNILEAEKSATDEAIRLWGGAVSSVFADEMPEYCADGVIEIAVSCVQNELRRGNKCTVAWFDSREDDGVSVRHITGMAGFDDVYTAFAASRVAPEEQRITSLFGIIGEAVNVTARIVTANADPQSLGEYATVPAMFGGAGSGCVAEILLFNPEDKYSSPRERAEYVVSARARMRGCGIKMTEIRETQAPDGAQMLISSDLV